jgi:hypothetical protein
MLSLFVDGEAFLIMRLLLDLRHIYLLTGLGFGLLLQYFLSREGLQVEVGEGLLIPPLLLDEPQEGEPGCGVILLIHLLPPPHALANGLLLRHLGVEQPHVVFVVEANDGIALGDEVDIHNGSQHVTRLELAHQLSV